ncbi:DUF6249 domain-containing protein [Paraferrimonas sedimenticola]|uniref:DUF6249 domain-containing protein n=1 Tax=Paraferrimonas sedimenticola TaxID=375674 RepID=A0AA37RYL9_9GAMM|nr:DUF6249 domain-containing protein [Paraferrimonas sedimenticola]GLP97012.1 hypothetical protein GCM10007895_23180 [Paraferrimonas sedimenticola]
MQIELVPIILFICITTVIWGYFHFSAKAKAEQHKTIQKLIEAGQALSPELLEQLATTKKNDGMGDLFRGLLSVFMAVALYIFGMYGAEAKELAMIAMFPLAIGLAYLILYWLRSRKAQD